MTFWNIYIFLQEKIYALIKISLKFLYSSVQLILQRSFWLCAQPKRSDVTLWCHLSLAGHIHKMIPDIGLAMGGHQAIRWSNDDLTHWGRVTHIRVSKLTIIGSDNDLSPGRRQAIIWTNAGILLIWPLGTNFSDSSIDIQTFSFKKIHSKMSSGKRQPFCLGLNVSIHWSPYLFIY